MQKFEPQSSYLTLLSFQGFLSRGTSLRLRDKGLRLRKGRIKIQVSTSTEDVVLALCSRRRQTCLAVDGKIYPALPVAGNYLDGATFMEVYCGESTAGMRNLPPQEW